MKPKTRRPRSKKGPISCHDEGFPSVESLVASLESLTRYLNYRYSKSQPNADTGVMGFIIERMRVEFTPQVTEVEVQTEFAKNFITIHAPVLEAETENEMHDRRIRLLRDFFPAIKESQIRATLQLYRTLSAEARVNLIRTYAEGESAK